MKSYLVIYIACSIILLLLFLSRRFRQEHSTYLVPWMVLGFVVAQFAITQLLATLDWERASSVERVLQGLVRTDQNAESNVLIVGSSYTSRGLDGQRIAQSSRDSGQPIRIGQLSYPGSFAHEQDFYLDRYLSLVRRPPNVVAVELGTEEGIEIKPENRFVSNVVRYHDATRLKWILRQAYQGDYPSAGTRMKLASDAIMHFLANLVNIGLIDHLEPANEVTPLSGFQPEDTPLNNGIEIQRDSGGAENHRPLDEAESAAIRTAVELRRWQSQKLKAAGVAEVWFYVTPSADPVWAQKMSTLCRQFSTCIDANSPRLLQQLDGPFWTDSHHLTRQGARLFSDWLGRELAVRLGNNNAV